MISPQKFKSFYFVRHGETDWNKANIYQGHNDTPLNDLGFEQAKSRAQDLKAIAGLSQVFTSPLIRAKRTAEILCEARPESIKLIEVPDLMECKSEESARFVLSLKKVQYMPSFAHLKGQQESKDEFLFRIKRGLEKVFDESQDASPLVVSHGGVCAGLCYLLNLPVLNTSNCCLLYFQYDGRRYVVHSL